MSVDSNHMTIVAFNGGRYVEIKDDHALWQGDYGQVLKFVDIDLPETFEVHFSNHLYGQSDTVEGSNNEVAIPNSLLGSGMPVYCWLFLHDTVNDGETEYRIDIQVKRRATNSGESINEVERYAAIGDVTSKTNRITTVAFNGGRYAKIDKEKSLWQGDYGQELQFSDVDLPYTFEVDFSNDRLGKSKTVLGTNNSVVIPDEYLVSGNPIFCWIVLHDGNDDGSTEYQVDIPVIRRAKKSGEMPTSEERTVIDEFISVLNSGVETVESAKDEVLQARDEVLEAAETFEPLVGVDYTSLGNLPTINGVTIVGDLTSADLNISGGGGGGSADYPPNGEVGDVLTKTGVARNSVSWVTPASDFSGDNTRPITAAAVYTEIGNINALLATI